MCRRQLLGPEGANRPDLANAANSLSQLHAALGTGGEVERWAAARLKQHAGAGAAGTQAGQGAWNALAEVMGSHGSQQRAAEGGGAAAQEDKAIAGASSGSSRDNGGGGASVLEHSVAGQETVPGTFATDTPAAFNPGAATAAVAAAAEEEAAGDDDGAAHEAGYDAWMTGCVFARLLRLGELVHSGTAAGGFARQLRGMAAQLITCLLHKEWRVCIEPMRWYSGVQPRHMVVSAHGRIVALLSAMVWQCTVLQPLIAHHFHFILQGRLHMTAVPPHCTNWGSTLGACTSCAATCPTPAWPAATPFPTGPTSTC